MTLYGYLLDYDQVAPLSSSTFGAELVGKRKLEGDWSVLYEAELAQQSEAGDNPNDLEAMMQEAFGMKDRLVFMDVVVDPIEGRNLLACGHPDAMAVAGIAPRGSMWAPRPAVSCCSVTPTLIDVNITTWSGCSNIIPATFVRLKTIVA